MKAFIVTMLDSACRPGELRTLQWNEVDLTSKEIRILPGKSKTGVGGDAPLSDRAMALLEMRQYLPDGKQMPGDAYVFGNDIGEQMSKDVLRNAWDRLRAAAGLEHLHLADLRHEAASRYDELDVPTAQISKLLGHASLTTTTRYVNPTKKALRRAVGKLNERNEAARLASGLQSHQPSDDKTEKASEVPAAVSHSTN